MVIIIELAAKLERKKYDDNYDMMDNECGFNDKQETWKQKSDVILWLHGFVQL